MSKSSNVWEFVFRQKGKYFTKPHESMLMLVKVLKENSAKKVLDLGCGSGRHVVYLAKAGFDVYGFDISPAGIKIAKAWIKKSGLKANLKVHDMNKKFPYKNKFFDAVVSIETFHHNTLEKIKSAIKEVERVLKSGGIVFMNFPTLKNQSRKFKKIGYRTLLPLEGKEKGLPHFYFTKKLIMKFFHNFKIRKIWIDREKHYCFIGVKK